MRLLETLWALLKEAGLDFWEDKAMQQGAALAFYCILSLAPLLVLTLAAAALVLDEDDARRLLAAQLHGWLGEESSAAIQGMLAGARDTTSGTLATALGMVTLFVGASGAFAQVQDSLNVVWEAPPRRRLGFVPFLRDRLLSLAMVLGTGALLLCSLVLSAGIAAVGKLAGATAPGLESLGHVLSSLATILLATVLFALIFKILPDVKIAWRDVWLGAGLTAVLFTAGKFAIGMYLGKSGLGSAYGAGGSLVALVVWFYYSAQIFLFGAEFTQVCARHFDARAPRAGLPLS